MIYYGRVNEFHDYVHQMFVHGIHIYIAIDRMQNFDFLINF